MNDDDEDQSVKQERQEAGCGRQLGSHVLIRNEEDEEEVSLSSVFKISKLSWQPSKMLFLPQFFSRKSIDTDTVVSPTGTRYNKSKKTLWSMSMSSWNYLYSPAAMFGRTRKTVAVSRSKNNHRHLRIVGNKVQNSWSTRRGRATKQREPSPNGIATLTGRRRPTARPHTHSAAAAACWGMATLRAHRSTRTVPFENASDTYLALFTINTMYMYIKKSRCLFFYILYIFFV